MDAVPQANVVLPRQHTSFVGRDDDIKQFAALLADPLCRLLTLAGPGGIGKTRLALDLARRVQLNFADGLYFVPLQPLQAADQVLSATIDALKVQIHQHPQQELLSWLEDKCLLLLMDNFEHVREGASLLREILDAAAQVKILVTSREALKLQTEWLRQVQGLDFPAAFDQQPAVRYNAVQLFLERARQRGIDLDPENEYPHIVAICQRVEGNPLALELAAGWVESLSCAAIAEELGRSTALLAARSHDIPPRHQSMQAVFDHSWRLLSEPERVVMRRFSVFRGGATREAAEQVTGATLPLLAGLVEKSLLRHDAGRYDMQELLRQYAAEQLDATGEIEATRAAHSAYYAAFLQQQWRPLRSERQVETLREIDQDFDNIRSAWQAMVETCNTAELGMAIYPIWYYSDLRGRYHDALTLFNMVEDSLRPYAGSSDAVDRATGQIVSCKGFFYVSLGDYHEAKILTEAGLAVLQRLGSPEDIVMGTINLTLPLGFLAEHQLAKQYSENALEFARQSGDTWLLAQIVNNIGFCQLALGASDDARKTLQEGLELAEACGDTWMLASLIGHGLGDSAYDRWEKSGQLAEGVRLWTRALALFEVVGQKVMIAQTHNNLARFALEMRNQPGVVNHLCQSLRLLVDYSGYTYHKVDAIEIVAEFWLERGQYEAAVALLTLARRHTVNQIRHDAIVQRLQEFKDTVPPESFEAAQERGQQRDMKQAIKNVLHELSILADEWANDGNAALPDPLTRRELEVLGLLAEGLSNNDIARRLVISEGTVRGHLNKLYGKLGVENRVQAVTQAQSLQLL